MTVSEKDDAPITASRDIEPDRDLFAHSVTIARSAGELYAFWRDPNNVALIVGPMASIVPLDGERVRWTVIGPNGTCASWVSTISEDRPGRTIFWQSEQEGDVENGGRIDFLDTDMRGAVVRVTLAFTVSAKVLERFAPLNLGAMVRAHARRILRGFKQMMEAREIATGARHRRMANPQSQ
ncbi:SRPBCC family protein [Novosphingobium sp. KACC 22771]|uniref:SRPBCC family protein n=1 Tax=Novosphingobium sp. KACC 22771 TaxID=3025670 RepID=UPI002365DB12|nr:SRPBCC family protein [Novosphingobium sp. KACC 22771]WDF71432.1 SRPBCC family protein [Novosphingobium sp. KACC 22771]